MKKATLKTANICTFKFRKSNGFFHCCYGDWWARKKEMPYASSVCFSLENVSVTFELSSEKNKLEFKLKKNKDFLSSTSVWGEKSGISFRAQILLKNGIEECKHYFSQKQHFL